MFTHTTRVLREICEAGDGGEGGSMKFYKKIYQADEQVVRAHVFNEDGKQVAYDFFMSPMWSQEGRFKKAHKWADKQIKNLEKYTC